LTTAVVFWNEAQEDISRLKSMRNRREIFFMEPLETSKIVFLFLVEGLTLEGHLPPP